MHWELPLQSIIFSKKHFLTESTTHYISPNQIHGRKPKQSLRVFSCTFCTSFVVDIQPDQPGGDISNAHPNTNDITSLRIWSWLYVTLIIAIDTHKDKERDRERDKLLEFIRRDYVLSLIWCGSFSYVQEGVNMCDMLNGLECFLWKYGHQSKESKNNYQAGKPFFHTTVSGWKLFCRYCYIAQMNCWDNFQWKLFTQHFVGERSNSFTLPVVLCWVH